MKKIHIALFASGNGTNAEAIFKFFAKHPNIRVKGLLTNNPSARVIDRARNHQIPCEVFDREQFADPNYMLGKLGSWEVDAVILAGFLWLIPAYLIERYPSRILNIHPALLPKFGGKGMYGRNVHRAVLASGEEKSGITIHLVNREYDKGKIIFQKECRIEDDDTPEALASRIHQLEHQFYPQVIERWLLKDTGGLAQISGE